MVRGCPSSACAEDKRVISTRAHSAPLATPAERCLKHICPAFTPELINVVEQLIETPFLNPGISIGVVFKTVYLCHLNAEFQRKVTSTGIRTIGHRALHQHLCRACRDILGTLAKGKSRN